MHLAKKKDALADQTQRSFNYVRRNLLLMVFIKSMGSLLAQIGLLIAGMNSVFLAVAMPVLIFFVGYYLIKTKLTPERAVRLEKLIPMFYLFLILAVVGNIASFLKNIDFI